MTRRRAWPPSARARSHARRPEIDRRRRLAVQPGPPRHGVQPTPIAPRPIVGAPTSSGGRFRILRFEAAGGLGEVYVAHDEELHREVALKQIKDEHADIQDRRSRFVVEAEITGGLEHPGIVPVYGLGHYDDGRPYYAMRFIQGESLKEAIKRFHQAEEPGRDPAARSLELRQLLRRFLDVCNAIQYAHDRGVLHRDLKPGNVMLGPYGETLVVDWGLAKVVGRPDPTLPEETLQPASGSDVAATVAGVAIGTPAYMSPEQARGDLDRLGPASDVYSLGATLYHLLTGQAPFQSTDRTALQAQVIAGEFPPPRQVHAGVPAGMDAICRKAMAREPQDRYATTAGPGRRHRALAGRRAGHGAARVVEPAGRAVDAAASGLGTGRGGGSGAGDAGLGRGDVGCQSRAWAG